MEAKVIIYRNPFNLEEIETYQVKAYSRVIDFLQKRFPNGFKTKTKVLLNHKQLNVIDYDIVINENDLIEIQIAPELSAVVIEKVAGWVTGAIFSTLVSKIFAQSLPDPPAHIKGLKNRGSAYDYRQQKNYVRLGEPIPVQYGKLKNFPDLAAYPYIRYVDNFPVYYYLFALGHGSFEINEIAVGNDKITNDNNLLSYSLYEPNTTIEDFDDNVMQVDTVSKASLALPLKTSLRTNCWFYKTWTPSDTPETNNNYPEANPNGWGKIVFYKEDAFEGFFVVGETIVLDDPQGVYSGEYEVKSIHYHETTPSPDLQAGILVDSSAWPSGNTERICTIVTKDTVTYNSVYTQNIKDTIGTSGGYTTSPYPYIISNDSFSGEFVIENPDYNDFQIDLNFSWENKFNVIDNDGNYSALYKDALGFMVPIDENNNPIEEEIYYIEEDVLEVASIEDTAENVIFEDYTGTKEWVDNSAGNIKFNNENKLYFYIEGFTAYALAYYKSEKIYLDNTYISEVDYVNRTIVINKDIVISEQDGITLSDLPYPSIFIYNIVYKDTTDEFLPYSLIPDAYDVFGGVDFPDKIVAAKYETVRCTPFSLGNKKKRIYSRYKAFIYRLPPDDYNYYNNIDNIHDSSVLNSINIIFDNTGSYSGVSVLACEIKANNNIKIEENISVVATRKLPVWDGSSWSEPIVTRSIAWAIADVWMASYGANLPYSRLDLDKLMELDTIFTERGDTFDAIFDTQITPWEAMMKIAMAGRTELFLDMNNNMVVFNRYEKKDTITAMFGPHNMLKDSFSIEYSFPDKTAPDAVKLTYLDEDDNYNPKIILSTENATAYQEIDFFGCTNYAMAWREAVVQEARIRKDKRLVTFDTELDGALVFPGDLINVTQDICNWGSTGFVRGKVGTTITTSEPLDFSGSAPFNIAFKKPDGSVSGPHEVVAGEDEYTCVLLEDVTDFNFITAMNILTPTQYQFGDSINWGRRCLVREVKHKSMFTYTLSCSVYEESIFEADEGDPPSKPSNTTGLVLKNISGLILTNTPGSGVIIIKWNPYYNAEDFIVEKSTDNINWELFSIVTTFETSLSQTGQVYIRVASRLGEAKSLYTKASIFAS
jgi:hypothetical protein